MGMINYHTSLRDPGAVAPAKEIQIGRLSPPVNVNMDVNLNAQADLIVVVPTYTFVTPGSGGDSNA